MAEKLYPNTLVSGREDGKLANTDNLFDKTQEIMQQEINRVLGKYFNYTSGNPTYGQLDGDVLKDGSVDLDAFTKEIQDAIVAAGSIPIPILRAIINSYAGLQSLVDNLNARVAVLEQNTDIAIADKKGFFVVDEEDNIGACIIPDETDGYHTLGWDGSVDSEPEYEEGRGTKVVVRGADFSNSGLGNISEDRDLTSFGVEYSPIYSGTELTLRVVPNPDDYEGTFAWRVVEGAEYVSYKNSSGNSITYNILSGANGGGVTIVCSSNQYPGMRPVTVSFIVNYAVPVEGVDILITGGKGDSSSDPIVGSAFQAQFTPNPFNTTFEWRVASGSAYVSIPEGQKYLNPATFNIIAPVSGVYSAQIAVDIHKPDGNTITATKTIYVLNRATALGDLDVEIQDGVVDGAIINDNVRFAVRSIPQAADPGTITWSVDNDIAEINEQGEMQLNALAKVGDTVVVRATSDKTTEGGDAIEGVAVLVNNWEPQLESLEITGHSTHVVGTGVQLRAVPTPLVKGFDSVTWEVRVGNNIASIDDQGKLTIHNGASHSWVTVRARSKVNTSVWRDVSFYATYDTSENPIVSIRHCGIVSGDKVTFYAFGYHADGTMETTPLSSDHLLWEVLWDYKSDDGEEENNSNVSSSPIVGIGGMPSHVGSNIGGHLLGNNSGGLSGNPDTVLNELMQQSGSGTGSNATYIAGSNGSMRMKTRGTNSSVLQFGAGTDADNVLSLNTSDTSGAIQQAYIRCTYDPVHTGSGITSGTGVFFDWYHEFELKTGKVAVGDGSLEFDGTKVEINDSKVVISAPKANKMFFLRNYVKCTTSNSVFDKKQLIFETIDNQYCKLTNAGVLTVKEGVTGQAVTIHYGYRHSGDGVEVADLRHAGTNTTATLLLSRSTEDVPVTAISIVAAKSYVGNTAGAVIDGGQLTCVDQNGVTRGATFSVVSGKQYLTINSLGYDMRIYDTGGKYQKVKVRATYKELIAKAEFDVKLES